MDTTVRANHWSLTINNPTEQDEANINLARQRGWKIEGQLEKGQEGTPHYQLLLHTPQVRFAAVKKVFPRAHIEVARNLDALREYVHKEETRLEELKPQSYKYPTVHTLYKRYLLWLDKLERLHNDLMHLSITKILDKADGNYDFAQDMFVDNFPFPRKEDYLPKWKIFIAFQIEQGVYIDQIATNPQILSFVKEYTRSILLRAFSDIFADRSDKTFDDEIE